ncbi:MAG: hypothetical protein ABI621_02165, partial [Chloroflexota bacterium]
MNQPSSFTFLRFVLAAISFLALFAYWDLLEAARRLNIIVSESKPWMGLFILLSAFMIVSLSLLAISFSRMGQRLVNFLESIVETRFHNYLGVLLISMGLSGFAIFTSNAYFIRVLGNASGVRYLIVALFSLVGMWGIKIVRRETAWMTALIVIVLSQSVIQLILFYFSQVTSYPFAMGWSETSRFYFPSLFLSEKVYGQKFPWPILHPTLHLLLAPPYLVESPLWFHRFWQVALRFLLVGLIVPPLLKRVSISDRPLRWLVVLWMFLFLFTGPVYFHLAVPVIIMLWGFSTQDERRTWVAVILASLWAGWSRVNWYPVPAMIAVVLYLLEEPVGAKKLWQYLLKPFLWFIAGTTVAFISQRLYIALSGIGDGGSFYTSLSSDL